MGKQDLIVFGIVTLASFGLIVKGCWKWLMDSKFNTAIEKAVIVFNYTLQVAGTLLFLIYIELTLVSGLIYLLLMLIVPFIIRGIYLIIKNLWNLIHHKNK